MERNITYQSPEFKKIAIPVMNDMLDDCIDNYNSDFEDWKENGMFNPPIHVQDGLEALEQMSDTDEVHKFLQVAYKQIQQYINNSYYSLTPETYKAFRNIVKNKKH